MVVAMSNKSFSPSISDGVAFQIVNSLLPGFMEKFGNRAESYEDAVFKPYTPSLDFIGKWEGQIESDEIVKNIFLEFQEDGNIIVGIEGQLMTILNNPIFENNTLKGKSFGFVKSHQENSVAKELEFNIRVHGNKIYGYVAEVYNRFTAWSPNVGKSAVDVFNLSLRKAVK